MKTSLILALAFLSVLVLSTQTVVAQITITIPKFPKITKPKTEKTNPKSSTSTNSESQRESETPKTGSTDPDLESEEESEISKNTNDKCDHWWVEMTVGDINKMRREVEDFTPDRGWLVGTSTYNHLLFSVSPNARENWLNASGGNKEFKNCPALLSAYDELKTAAAKKLPLFVPNKREYAIQNAAMAKLMHGKINNLADHKVFYTALKEANWLIDKNSLGIPTARYKHGLVWVRYAGDEHPYCRIYWINLVQDYAGGGTYGATYGNFVGEDIAGCPA